ncbi:MAG: carboxypeptidase regulatory-like domain-containing protein [Acidobacteria bacterium]|nr:carboxypeptidase regulatory-like domain-containing protein [Acidobacteriota bacterium]
MALLVFLPDRADAQSAIAGVVKDATGAVLPGVTVEASSPALIEQVKTVATDAAGLYRIIDLRPGAYVVTFTLPGFNVVKRDGIELPSDFTATVNAEMKIGAIEETVTVTGASPVVDIKSATQGQHLGAGVDADRRDAERAGRGRHGRHAAVVRGRTRLPATRQRHPGGRDERERDRGGRRDPELLQRGHVPGNELSDERPVGGSTVLGRASEHDSEGGRQRVQRLRVPVAHAGSVAEQQLH